MNWTKKSIKVSNCCTKDLYVLIEITVLPTMLISLIFLLLHHCFDLIFYTIPRIPIYFYYFSCKFSFFLKNTTNVSSLRSNSMCERYFFLTSLQIFHGNCEDLQCSCWCSRNWIKLKISSIHVTLIRLVYLNVINHLLYLLHR